MKQKKLLFSKVEKSDKSTSMGEQNENIKSKLGIPATDNKETNKEKPNGGKENGANKDQKPNEKKKIEKVSDTFINGTPVKLSLQDLMKETERLRNDKKSKEEEFKSEQNMTSQEVKDKNKTIKQQQVKLRVLSNDFKKKIDTLKEYEKSLVIPEKKKVKNTGPTEEEYQKYIKVIEEQIKIYEKSAKSKEKNMNLLVKSSKKKENKKNKNEQELTEINNKIKILSDMKQISIEHNECEEKIRELREEYETLKEKYQKQLKIKEGHESTKDTDIPDERTNKEENEEEEINKNEGAIEDIKTFLPKINNLKFQVDSAAKLESRIIKKNRLAIKNVNALNLYNKVNKEVTENERYLKEKEKEKEKEKKKENQNENEEKAKKIFKTNKNRSNISLNKEYLFSEHENNVLEKVLPKDMINSYRNKFNDLINQKKELKKIFNTESNEIENDKYIIKNKKDYNEMQIIELKRKNVDLKKKYNKICQNINKMKKESKEVMKNIEKEEKKIKVKASERRRIELWCKAVKQMKENQDNQENNNDEDSQDIQNNQVKA